MMPRQATGQGAASKKYDMLTALGAMACAGTVVSEKTGLRLMLLVTARYNWARDELSLGRSEIARLWQVDERTVKRELARLKEKGWVTVKRPAARGRVTVYAIDWSRILSDSATVWNNIGPDFAARMGGPAPVETPSPKVVAFPVEAGQGPWDRVKRRLAEEAPGFYGSWGAKLTAVEIGADHLTLAAPTSFHAQYVLQHGLDYLYRAAVPVIPGLSRIEVTGP